MNSCTIVLDSAKQLKYLTTDVTVKLYCRNEMSKVCRTWCIFHTGVQKLQCNGLLRLWTRNITNFIPEENLFHRWRKVIVFSVVVRSNMRQTRCVCVKLVVVQPVWANFLLAFHESRDATILRSLIMVRNMKNDMNGEIEVMRSLNRSSTYEGKGSDNQVLTGLQPSEEELLDLETKECNDDKRGCLRQKRRHCDKLQMLLGLTFNKTLEHFTHPKVKYWNFG